MIDLSGRPCNTRVLTDSGEYTFGAHVYNIDFVCPGGRFRLHTYKNTEHGVVGRIDRFMELLKRDFELGKPIVWEDDKEKPFLLRAVRIKKDLAPLFDDLDD